MKIIEYVIPMPFNKKDYFKGLIYTESELSRIESTSKEDGLEVVENKFLEKDGNDYQYTYKVKINI
jgi:hypothetical protein